MRFIDKNTIKLDKIMNELDRFVFKFIKILIKYTDYIIVSGYVSILLGRSRSTEDVDIFINEISKEKFQEFYNNLLKQGFWCLNGEEIDEIYSYLSEGLAVRFALKNQTAPNFEVKFAKKKLDKESFSDFINVATEIGNLKISSLEKQIAFKRYFLKSDKDIEDARHIEKVFKEHIDNRLVNKYKKLIENEMAKTR